MGLNVRQQKIAISMRPPHLCPHNEFIEQGTQRFPDPGRNDRPGAQRLGQLMSPETATAIPKSELQGTQAAHRELWDHYHNHITALVPAASRGRCRLLLIRTVDFTLVCNLQSPVHHFLDDTL